MVDTTAPWRRRRMSMEQFGLMELEELRLQDPKRFLEFLEAHGCCIGDQDLLSCFENEEGLQPLGTRRANRHAAGLSGVEPPGPDHVDYVSLMMTALSTYFKLNWQWGHLVCRSRSRESEEPSCKSKELERHLNTIPEHLGNLKRQFTVEASRAVRIGDWKILVSIEKWPSETRSDRASTVGVHTS